jgi:hypothetical protein
MRLRAWRDTWMWLAVSACGAPALATKSPTPKVSIFDAPPLSGATYVATVEQGDFGHPGPRVGLEHGSFQCRVLVNLLGREQDNQDQIAAQARSCDVETARLLRERQGFVFVIDGAGKRWLSAQDVLAAAQPIDTPAKALLAVWLKGTYELSWGNGKRYYGGPEDGLVRAAKGGFEVIGSTSVTDSDCGGRRPRQTVTNYRHTLFIDSSGTIREREKVVSHRYDIADPCHPMGRRPVDFVDVASGGTVRGHLLRAMHHEAESVRAFERIARELRAHGAPAELIDAAEAAAREERVHAERCAALVGTHVEIATDELPARSLAELAIDNAREGCVGEAFAALCAVVQAQAAATPALREHFAAIASDELGHAALAHAIAAWLDAKLDATDRARVAAARGDAFRVLAASLDTPATAATRALGMPEGALAARLLAAVAGAA